METYFEKKRFITAPIKNTLLPSKAKLVKFQGDLKPTDKGDLPLVKIRRGDRPAAHRQQPFDLFFGPHVAGVAVQPEQISHRSGSFAIRTIHQER